MIRCRGRLERCHCVFDRRLEARDRGIFHSSRGGGVLRLRHRVTVTRAMTDAAPAIPASSCQYCWTNPRGPAVSWSGRLSARAVWLSPVRALIWKSPWGGLQAYVYCPDSPVVAFPRTAHS